jgi:hypothetical protein
MSPLHLPILPLKRADHSLRTWQILWGSLTAEGQEGSLGHQTTAETDDRQLAPGHQLIGEGPGDPSISAARIDNTWKLVTFIVQRGQGDQGRRGRGVGTVPFPRGQPR